LDFQLNLLILLFISPYFRNLSMFNRSTNENKRNDAMSDNKQDDYISIMGNSVDEVMKAFQTKRLSEQSYAILSPIARHRYVVAGGTSLEETLNAQEFFTAVFARRNSTR
jgi:hypothetical protein